MNARELMKIGGGRIIAVFLAGCMILGFEVLGIAGHQFPLPVSSGDAGSAADFPVYNRSITLEVPLPTLPQPSHCTGWYPCRNSLPGLARPLP